MLVVGQLAAAVLVAIGIDALRTASRPVARLLRPALVVAAAVGMHALGVAGRKSAMWHPDPMAIGVACAAIILAWVRRAAIRTAAVIALLALAVGDRFAAPANQLMGPEHNDEAFFAPPPFARFLHERAANDRVLVVRDLNTRFPLTEKAGTLFDLNVVQDYEPLAPRIYQTFLAPLEKFNIDSPLFWGRIYPPAREDLWRPLDMLAVRYVVAEHRTGWLRQSTARFRELYRDDQVTIYENLAALPRAFVVRDVEVESDPDAAIARVLGPGFDPRRTVVLDAPPPAGAMSNPEGAGETVEIAEVSADEVRVRVAIRRAAILVLADLYWPGWRAFVDGKEAPLRRANGLFRGVAVEPGAHDVRFVYSPASVRIGAATSLATLASSPSAQRAPGGAVGRRRCIRP
jgi:hypothetical protein